MKKSVRERESEREKSEQNSTGIVSIEFFVETNLFA